MLSMKQERGEAIRSFSSKVQGKAATCGFNIECTKAGCDQKVEFSHVVVKYVLVNGIADDDIKKEVLGWTNLDESSLAETIKFI